MLQKFSLRLTAALCAAVFAGIGVNVSASGIDALQKKVDQIAAQKGVPAPNVKKELAGKAKSQTETEDEQAQRTREALRNVPPIERIVAINAETIRAIKSADGKLMFLVDNGRFAFVGKMIDVWNRKELNTIEDIAEAVTHIDLARMGFKLEKVNHISVGTGEKHVVAFVDPQCGWCHRLMTEINANPQFFKDYTFDFVIVPVLGQRSEQLSKKLFCAKNADQDKKYAALTGGARSIDLLEQNEDCDLDVFNQTRVIAQAVGVRGVPMVIADDGRFERGKPQDLSVFLNPSKAEPAKTQDAQADKK